MKNKDNPDEKASPDTNEKNILSTIINVEELAEMIGQFYDNDSIEILAINPPETTATNSSANDEMPAIDNRNVIPFQR